MVLRLLVTLERALGADLVVGHRLLVTMDHVLDSLLADPLAHHSGDLMNHLLVDPHNLVAPATLMDPHHICLVMEPTTVLLILEIGTLMVRRFLKNLRFLMGTWLLLTPGACV